MTRLATIIPDVTPLSKADIRMLRSRMVKLHDPRRYAILSSSPLTLWYDVATGCWVSSDIRHSTLFFNRSDAQAVIENLKIRQQRMVSRTRPFRGVVPMIITVLVVRPATRQRPAIIRLTMDGLSASRAQQLTTFIQRLRGRRLGRSLPRMETDAERHARRASVI